MYVFLNGQIVRQEEAKVSVSDLSYQFGYGLFETIKCEQEIPLFFESHFKRLTHSAREIGMEFPVDYEDVRSWIVDVLKANKLKTARVKIIISKRIEAEGEKFNVLVMASPLDAMPSSYKLLCKKLERDTSSISYIHKTTSRADSYIAYKGAMEEGLNEVLYKNDKNELVECSRANIFLVMEDKIVTPIIESGILWGTTRERIIDLARKEGLIVEEKNIHSLFLNRAVDVFTTNALIGIMPVSMVKNDEKEHQYTSGSITTRLRNSYDSMVNEYISSLVH